jgi:hypothetical protein
MSTRGAAPDAPLIAHHAPIHDYLADWRAESLGRMLRDAARAVRRWAPKGLNRLDRDALAQDATCLIVGWRDVSGADDGAYVIPCGAEGCAPSREVWRARDDWREPSNSAWILLHRAIVQALRAPDRLGWRPPSRDDGLPREMPTDPVELDTLRETHGAGELAPSLAQLGADHAAREDAASGIYSPIPDDVSIRALADAGEIPLRAARALAYQSVGMSREDAASAWGMTLASVDVAVSNGARWIRDTYPETAQLATMLRETARAIRADRLERATNALYDFLYPDPESDPITRAEAMRAVNEWRESSRTAPGAIVALEIATRRAYWRAARRLRYVEDGADIAREIRRAVDAAKLGEYARLAAPGTAPLHTAPENPARLVMFSVRAHGRRKDRRAVPYNVRRETAQERDTRLVRYVQAIA